MVNANVEIIKVLQSFLKIVVEFPEVRTLFTTKSSDFSRTRKLPLEKIAGMLINLPKRSLSIELNSFFECLDESDFGCTKGAFSLQRTKLKPLFFKIWNDFLIESFYFFYGKAVKRWEGFRLLAVDGSNINVMNIPEVVAHFGSADNQFGSAPMARVMQIHDVLNDLTIWGDVLPVKYSENEIIAHQVTFLPIDSLTLFDRGYPSYSLIFLLEKQESPRHFVMRCRGNFNNEVKKFVASKNKNQVTTIYPSLESIDALRRHGYIVIKDTGIAVRMVKVVLPDGEIEILLTNLYDDKIFTFKKMRKLYFMRWKIEIAYNKQKNQMQMEIFSGHRLVCIEQDYAAGLFVANLQSVIEKQCEKHVKKIGTLRRYKCKINRNISWAFLKNRIPKLLIQLNDSFKILMELQHLFSKYVEPVRPDRQIERTRPKRRPGKYRTFTNYRRAI